MFQSTQTSPPPVGYLNTLNTKLRRLLSSAVLFAFAVLVGTSELAQQPRPVSNFTELQTAVAALDTGDTLVFNNDIGFANMLSTTKTGISLTGADLVDGKPTTQLEKGISTNYRFFNFSSNFGDANRGGISNLIFKNNGSTVTVNGGAVYVSSNFTGGITNSRFTGNEAGTDSGAMWVTSLGLSSGYSDMSGTGA
jgi:hypothetical protein